MLPLLYVLARDALQSPQEQLLSYGLVLKVSVEHPQLLHLSLPHQLFSQLQHLFQLLLLTAT